ncbi:MAG: bifunctional phosphopantothenoylcysteine decarboxylase/phosphopantothenate--cysteine ligase CoaBC [Flavobacteriales bacterium]|jgi:phosphopantothenoylcysteine decarboxylase/phosphopantothenate--cysteine ligase|tara:strand:+ start:62386 stop:63576 length:1191 start_codon:yes stop_codon:yes gene_type:complete
MLNGKNVLLGITASIAAYKSASIVRLLKKSGAQVKVIQTPESANFITSLTLSTLSENDVLLDLVDSESNTWNNHVELSLWADLMIIAPLTAKSMSKMVQGNCDNLLLATYLSAKCPVYFAPAMDLDMYKHPSTINNINKLTSFSNIHIPATYGFLASGLEGEGRMCEPEEIISFIKLDLEDKLILKGKKILITSGPTREAIDKVRYISNYSSGKMGFSLAKVAISLGANVTMISGPTDQVIEKERLDVINVVSAEDMFNEVEAHLPKYDIIIFAAAVSDFKPKDVFTSKLKNKNINLELVQTNDIAMFASTIRTKNQIIVGFALETENGIINAKEKLIKKDFDLIILNSLQDKNSGFNYDTNKITIIDKASNVYSFKLKDKIEVAKDIFDKIIELT